MKELKVEELPNGYYRFKIEDKHFDIYITKELLDMFMERAKGFNFVNLDAVEEYLHKLESERIDTEYIVISKQKIEKKIKNLEDDVEIYRGHLKDGILSEYERETIFKRIESKYLELETLRWVLENKKLYY